MDYSQLDNIQVDHSNDKSSGSFGNEITNHTVKEIEPAKVSLCCTINASDLGNSYNNPKPTQHISSKTLSPVNVTAAISSTMPGVIKILSIGMSPDPLKVGDVPEFTMTYQNISDKPVIVIGGCYPSLFYTITPSSNVQLQPHLRALCVARSEFVKPNQTVTDLGLLEDKFLAQYKIIKNGTLNVNMKLHWSANDRSPDQMSKVNFTLNIQ